VVVTDDKATQQWQQQRDADRQWEQQQRVKEAHDSYHVSVKNFFTAMTTLA
jgi:hypothetical protein